MYDQYVWFATFEEGAQAVVLTAVQVQVAALAVSRAVWWQWRLSSSILRVARNGNMDDIFGDIFGYVPTEMHDGFGGQGFRQSYACCSFVAQWFKSKGQDLHAEIRVSF